MSKAIKTNQRNRGTMLKTQGWGKSIAFVVIIFSHRPSIHLKGEIGWAFWLPNINARQISRVTEIYLAIIDKIIINSYFLRTIISTLVLQSEPTTNKPSLKT